MNAVDTPSDLKQLYASIQTVQPPWTDKTPQDVSTVQFCIVTSQHSCPPQQQLVVTCSLIIHQNLTWKAFVLGHVVDTTNTPLSGIPPKLNAGSLLKVLELLRSATVCPGNPDKKLTEMLASRKGKRVLSDSGEVVASLKEGFEVQVNGELFNTTVRIASCNILEHGGKCDACRQYCSNLRSLYSKWSRKTTSIPKHGNNQYLNTPQKQKKLQTLQSRARSTEREVQRLHKIIAHSTEQSGVQVDSDLHSDLQSIMEESNDQMLKDFPQGTFRRLF